MCDEKERKIATSFPGSLSLASIAVEVSFQSMPREAKERDLRKEDGKIVILNLIVK